MADWVFSIIHDYVHLHRTSPSPLMQENREWGVWWFCNMSTCPDWTIFPRIPSPLCFKLGWTTRETLVGNLEDGSEGTAMMQLTCCCLSAGSSWCGAAARPAARPPSWVFLQFPDSWASSVMKGTIWSCRTPTPSKSQTARIGKGFSLSSWVLAHACGFQLTPATPLPALWTTALKRVPDQLPQFFS